MSTQLYAVRTDDDHRGFEADSNDLVGQPCRFGGSLEQNHLYF
jgi:hypothetical protein